MATGSGKTFTAITSVYRLLKHADAKRILFLVDTKNLGEQAEQEFMSYLPNDDNRKFTELYNVQRLKSHFIAGSSQVCISTIQRMYSVLKDEPLDESAEETNPAEWMVKPKQPLPVVYNKKIPPEFFDFIIIDECHRSIYNVWRQVIEYFDAYLIGLTATPDIDLVAGNLFGILVERCHRLPDRQKLQTGAGCRRPNINLHSSFDPRKKKASSPSPYARPAGRNPILWQAALIA
jgi:type I site-specific restriction endonuclease